METIVIPIDEKTKNQIKAVAKKLGLKLAPFCRMAILEKINRGNLDGKIK